MAPLRCANAASSARFFVQLAKRSAASPSSAPFLDVLAPRLCARPAARSAYSTAATRPRAKRPNELRGCTALDSSSHATNALGQTRTFMSSTPRRATACVRNPLKDEDGNDMFLEITDRAGKRLSQIMKKDDNPNLALRIQVESGGCHGFQYVMSLVTLPPHDLASGAGDSDASVLAEDDSIFQYAAEGEAAPDAPAAGAPKIVIDEPSLELLKGSKVDFTMELIGSQFKIADNPYATSACGCGTSFDIKI